MPGTKRPSFAGKWLQLKPELTHPHQQQAVHHQVPFLDVQMRHRSRCYGFPRRPRDDSLVLKLIPYLKMNLLHVSRLSDATIFKCRLQAPGSQEANGIDSVRKLKETTRVTGYFDCRPTKHEKRHGQRTFHKRNPPRRKKSLGPGPLRELIDTHGCVDFPDRHSRATSPLRNLNQSVSQPTFGPVKSGRNIFCLAARKTGVCLVIA